MSYRCRAFMAPQLECQDDVSEQHPSAVQRGMLFMHSCTQCTGVRTQEAQSLLSQLAACPNIHLVASFDDVNTPVLWDE